MITNYIYQRPASVLVQYGFTLDWQPEGVEETTPLSSIVTVSLEKGQITIMDISLDGEAPEGFFDAWRPEEAIKVIQAELGEEFHKLTKTFETF